MTKSTSSVSSIVIPSVPVVGAAATAISPFTKI